MKSFIYDSKEILSSRETLILLAEDSEVQARILHAVFKKAGYRLLWVPDGALAYEAIKNGFTPNLLVTDVFMPGMTGFELITRLNSEKILPPTIVLTGLQKEEEVLRGLKCGADDYIKKPFSPEVLLARAELVLSRRKVA